VIAVNLLPTELNQRLADAVRYSVAAERFYIVGKAGFWRLVGVGLIALGLGAAVGMGFFGYANITRNSSSEAILSSAFSKALSEAKLHGKVEGAVQIEPRELPLAKGQTVSIDPSSRLLLDPTAKVNADGELRVQAPSISVPKTTVSPSRASRLPITNFTVFKSVPFESGHILTGWRFLTSAQTQPTNQYCYYSTELDTPSSSLRIDVATNEKLDPTAKDMAKNFDVVSAFDKCVWYKSASQ
jgi:hypothetical protein